MNIDKQIKKLIRPNDFCRITSKVLEKYDVEKGSVVYVASSQAVPTDENDLYNQRIVFSVQKVKKRAVQFNEGFFMVDPSHLKKVGKAMQESLNTKLQEDFKEARQPVEGEETPEYLYDAID